MLKKYSIILSILILVALVFWGSKTLQNFFNDIVSVFQIYVENNYFLSILIFLGLSVFSVMLFSFSSVWLIPLAIPVWGNFLTFILLLLGWLLGSIFSYIIGRYAGYRFLKYFISKEKIDYYSDLIFNGKNSFNLILLIRFVLPSEVPGYVSGIAKNNFFKYFISTFIVEVPYALMTVYAVEAVIKKEPLIFIPLTVIWFISAVVLFKILQDKLPKSKIGKILPETL